MVMIGSLKGHMGEWKAKVQIPTTDDQLTTKIQLNKPEAGVLREKSRKYE